MREGDRRLNAFGFFGKSHPKGGKIILKKKKKEGKNPDIRETGLN